MFRRFIFVAAIAIVAWYAPSSHALPRENDHTVEAAADLLSQAMRMHRDNRQRDLIAALRGMRDPKMKPILIELAQAKHPHLQIQGLLGLAQIHPQREMDLVRIAGLDEAGVRVHCLSAAMDADLLPVHQMKELMAAPGTDVSTKLVLATQLVGLGQFQDGQLLDDARKSAIIGRRAIAGLLMMQLGQPDGLQPLIELNQSDAREKELVQRTLLRKAFASGFDQAGPWAMTIVNEPDSERNTHALALMTALRLGTPGGVSAFLKQYEAAQDLAQRLRLGLVALQALPWTPDRVFEPLLADDNELLQKMGVAGRAVTRKSAIPDAILELARGQYKFTNQWLLGYARQHASPIDRREILRHAIFEAKIPPSDNLQVRLELTKSATAMLANVDSDFAVEILKPVIADRETGATFKQVLLLGLNLSHGQSLDRVIAPTVTFTDHATQGLALVLRARHQSTLTDTQLDELSLLVRGGGPYPRPLRMQAAWLYLAHTGQIDVAITRAIQE